MIPDPVFEAIDLHRAAWCAQMATMDLADGPLAREQGRTVTPADVGRRTNGRIASKERPWPRSNTQRRRQYPGRSKGCDRLFN